MTWCTHGASPHLMYGNEVWGKVRDHLFRKHILLNAETHIYDVRMSGLLKVKMDRDENTWYGDVMEAVFSCCVRLKETLGKRCDLTLHV